MPVATPEEFADMLDRAKRGAFAYPAVNVASSEMLVAALRGFAEAESDGIVQISTAGASYLSGSWRRSMVDGATAFARYAHEVATAYPTKVALHTDHCPQSALSTFLEPLLDKSRDRSTRGRPPLFQSHMWDGSGLPLEQNLSIAERLLDRCHRSQVILEIELGVIGGDEDGAATGEAGCTTVADAARTASVLGVGERGRYLLAAAFGNAHGYGEESARLRPELLGDIQDGVGHRLNIRMPFDLVFHGGSGVPRVDLQAAIKRGVVKVNLDTDTRYAFSRPVIAHVLRHFGEAPPEDGQGVERSFYDPLVYGREAELSMARRVTQACDELGSAGLHLQ